MPKLDPWTTLLVLTFTALGPLRASASDETPLAADDARASAAFDHLKQLEGRWRADSTQGWSEEVAIEVIARGSVVMSTTLFEEGRKMVTMYSLDGDRLVLTHYCEARNQPHLVATEISPDASSLLFTFERGGNLPTRDRGHMDSARLRLLDSDRFSSRWTWYQDGAENWMEEITYRRIH